MTHDLIDEQHIWIDDPFISHGDALYHTLAESVQWDTRIRARQSASFGRPYNYSGILWPEAPFPEAVQALLAPLAARLGYWPNNCLANYYLDGHAKMGFHADATDDLVDGSGIAVLSLGAAREITFRSQADKTIQARYLLRSGSLLYMTAQMQQSWKHAILAQSDPCEGRISLTFRCMRG